jgi:hypothetical protein
LWTLWTHFARGTIVGRTLHGRTGGRFRRALHDDRCDFGLRFGRRFKGRFHVDSGFDFAIHFGFRRFFEIFWLLRSVCFGWLGWRLRAGNSGLTTT